VVDARVERYAGLLLDTCLGVQRGWQVTVWDGSPRNAATSAGRV